MVFSFSRWTLMVLVVSQVQKSVRLQMSMLRSWGCRFGFWFWLGEVKTKGCKRVRKENSLQIRKGIQVLVWVVLQLKFYFVWGFFFLNQFLCIRLFESEIVILEEFMFMNLDFRFIYQCFQQFVVRYLYWRFRVFQVVLYIEGLFDGWVVILGLRVLFKTSSFFFSFFWIYVFVLRF